jgi:PTH1 family peptidyl-tRNA hydrolase
VKLVVGLGNPGPRYAGTRHNVGFDVIDAAAARWKTAVDRYEARFEGQLGEAWRGDDRVLLLKPLTFMNLSGRSVQAVRQFYKIEPGDLLVVADDLDLEPGRLRMRAGGSSGGQKGLHDILRCLGVEQIARLRIGIGKPARASATEHVLERFSPAEREIMSQVLSAAVDAVETWLDKGVDAAMNRFNAWKHE